MLFLKKSFFGLIWSTGLFLFISLMIGIFLSSDIESANTNQTSQEGYNIGHEFGQKYSTILFFIPLAIGFGGSFMEILPGTRKKSKIINT